MTWIPPHCWAPNTCAWCRERLARKRRQNVKDIIALAKPSTETYDYKNKRYDGCGHKAGNPLMAEEDARTSSTQDSAYETDGRAT